MPGFESFSHDEVFADLLKTAGDLSKEAAPSWKQKMLAPALGLGMALSPGATPAKAQEPQQQTQQAPKQEQVTVKGKTYDSGTVKVEYSKPGTWTDTTYCTGRPGAESCSGGISDDVQHTLSLALPDGSTVELYHEGFSHDVLDDARKSADSFPVKYRINKRWDGRTFVYVLMSNGKESEYAVGKPRVKKEKQTPGLAQ